MNCFRGFAPKMYPLFKSVNKSAAAPPADDVTPAAIKLMAAMISGVRLHHFYVDSKIWKVSKSPALAKNLDVELPAKSATA